MPARAIAALSAIVLAVAACATLSPVLRAPTVELAQVQVTRLSAGDTRVRLLLVVHNPNSRDLVVDALDAQVTVEGGPFATGTLAAPATLRADADSRVEIEARTDAGTVIAAIERVMKERRARYEMSTTALVAGARFVLARRGELPVAGLLGTGP